MRATVLMVVALWMCATVVMGQSDSCCFMESGCDNHCPQEGRVMSELFGHTTCGDPCHSAEQPDNNVTLPRHENIPGMRTIPTVPRNTINLRDFHTTLSFMQKVFNDRLRMYSTANDAEIENLRATRVTKYLDMPTRDFLKSQYDRDHLLYSFFLGAEGGDRTMVHLANGCPRIDNTVCFVQPTNPNTVTIQTYDITFVGRYQGTCSDLMNDARIFAVVCGDSETSETTGKTTFNAKVHVNPVVLLNYMIFRQATEAASLRIEPSEENSHYMATRLDAFANLEIVFSDDVEFAAEISAKDLYHILSEETSNPESMATFSSEAASTSSGESISAGAAAGIAVASTVGAIALLALVVTGAVLIVKRRSMKQQLQQQNEGRQMERMM